MVWIFLNRGIWQHIILPIIVLVALGSALPLGVPTTLGDSLTYEFYDDFGVLDTSLWSVQEFGTPSFPYNCGVWLEGESWLYVPEMRGGGTNPAYNGYHFVHTLAEPFMAEFQVETELAWSTDDYSSAYQIALRLLDANDDPISDQGFSIQVQCRDYWEHSSGRQTAHIEDDMVEGNNLPLSGNDIVRITRDSNYQVSIYWRNTLLMNCSNNDTITRICLRIVGRYDYQGASGGFNYCSYQQSPPGTINFALLIIGLILISVIISMVAFYLVQRLSRQRPPISDAPKIATTQMSPQSGPKPTQLDHLICPYCNGPLQQGDNFCFQCGARVREK